ncbi:MAG: FAD:protein FMN transferase [Chlorobiales bacterium]|nr:FAD:protein FMN transferase [Chlorobiales bacterium]
MRWLFSFCLFWCLAVRPVFAQETAPESERVILYEIKLLKYMMGTNVEVKAVHPNITAAKKGIYHAFKEIERIDTLLGYRGSGSDVARINAVAGKHPVKISDETFQLLVRTQTHSKKYFGVFDITIGPIEELWGFNLDHSPGLPADMEIKKLLPLVNYQQLVLNAKDTTAFLTVKGMKLDLGGVAKGYAIDRAVKILRRYDVQNFIIKAGGDMYVSGMKSPTEMWSIGIQHPRQTGELFALMELKDCAISTSGDYERYFMKDGIRYHHILEPKTGYPSRQCKSVSVISRTSAEETDALSTTLFIMGAEKVKANGNLKSYLIVDRKGKLHLDSALVRDRKLSILTQGAITD